MNSSGSLGGYDSNIQLGSPKGNLATNSTTMTINSKDIKTPYQDYR